MNANVRLSEGKTAGIVTGKSQHSAYDFFEKIETNFLEKYMLYLLKDEVATSYLNVSEVNDNNNQVYLYKTIKKCKMSQLVEEFQRLFYSKDTQSIPVSVSHRKKDQTLIKVFQNENGKRDQVMQPNEYFFMYSKFKVPHQKLRDLGNELQKRLSKERVFQNKSSVSSSQTSLPPRSQQESQEENKKIINIIMFYSGDINFKFERDEFLTQNTITLHQQEYEVRMHIFFTSKVSLFQYFCQTNNLNIEQIDDKTITLFELKRLSYKRRKAAMLKAQRMKTPQSRTSASGTNNSAVFEKSQQKTNNQQQMSSSQQMRGGNQQQQLNQQQNQNTQQNNLDQQQRRQRSSRSVDTLSNFAQLSIILGLAVGAPILVKKCWETPFLKSIFTKK